ncbi:suppressor of fused domain protein [Pseudonocardia xinjiangensis]|uniref:Suppressor of fused domain protein n=1 Tax=Pseudonocardia xinjiangensis TaxID=75289 RepID=A0ABX1RLQ0_9PSEU|nr:suppressor of fused domain protein [Pseudonocardia xinjiangensis]NMH80404.1 suppressor of fused domain protein [Pseudonocardia xinjiangensis]
MSQPGGDRMLELHMFGPRPAWELVEILTVVVVDHGPSLENLSLPDGSTVRCAWLIPITSAEVRYKKKHGLEALEERFEAGGLDYLDPHRASVC